MPSSSTEEIAPTPEFLARFRARAKDDALRFDAFMDLALFDPVVGYYRRAAARVGYGKGTDFFTATTSGPIFGELLCAACAELLPEQNLREYTFVEIGAEPSGGILREVAHPFGGSRIIELGQPIELSGKVVVFSNELFDAQPFRRFVFQSGRWRERFVRSDGPRLFEEVRDVADEALRSAPKVAAEGYQLDLPFASVDLLRKIVGEKWQGLFIAFDYGKSWQELVEAQPGGTARAYFQHTQRNDLLAQPGQQDLTCHVCWDWLSDALKAANFSAPRLESQEAFFVHYSGSFIGPAIAAEAARMSQRKLALLQLLHPAHLGQKFQVLHARRMAPCASAAQVAG